MSGLSRVPGLSFDRGACNVCGNSGKPGETDQYSLADVIGRTPSAYYSGHSHGYSNTRSQDNKGKGTSHSHRDVNSSSPARASASTNSDKDTKSHGYGIGDAAVGLEQGVFGTANNIIGGATLLGETALLGAGELAYAAGSGATNLAKGVVGGVQGLAQGGAQGGYQGRAQGGYQGGAQGGYQGGAQGGAQGGYQGGAQGGYQGGAQGGAQGGYQGGVSQGGVQIGAQGNLAQLSGPQNPYTYNGTLADKPSSDFIPITGGFQQIRTVNGVLRSFQ
jgi:hypothetical protein